MTAVAFRSGGVLLSIPSRYGGARNGIVTGNNNHGVVIRTMRVAATTGRDKRGSFGVLRSNETEGKIDEIGMAMSSAPSPRDGTSRSLSSNTSDPSGSGGDATTSTRGRPRSSAKADVFRFIARSRKSAKRFQTSRIIPSNILKDILHTTTRSPSGFNLQPSQIILVRDDDVKDELAKHVMLGVGNQFRVRDCSAVAVFLSDVKLTDRIRRVQRLENDWGYRHPNYSAYMPLTSSVLLGEGHLSTAVKQFASAVVSQHLKLQPMPAVDDVKCWSYKNTSLLVQSYVLAATSYDSATCIMEGYDSSRLKQVLRVPTDRYEVPMIVATGYDYDGRDDQDGETGFHEIDVDDDDDDSLAPRLDDGTYTPRLELDEVVFEDIFGKPYDSDRD